MSFGLDYFKATDVYRQVLTVHFQQELKNLN